ncbi:hypothetical protein ACODNH_02140 (plasmid) [Haloarcula sp. NS06]|uniref:hypothetical protein n=1 Tax=Haloarcula sp. NS06 TaxID=3409688 RepID=UPI003DA6EE40
MNRRALLSTIACGTSILLAGCGSQAPENEVEITVRNDSQKVISMDIFFTQGDSETVFSAHYSLDAEKANEAKSFTGSADRAYVIVNESQAKVIDFVNKPCSGTNTVPFGVAYSETEGIQVGTACSE